MCLDGREVHLNSVKKCIKILRLDAIIKILQKSTFLTKKFSKKILLQFFSNNVRISLDVFQMFEKFSRVAGKLLKLLKFILCAHNIVEDFLCSESEYKIEKDEKNYKYLTLQGENLKRNTFFYSEKM